MRKNESRETEYEDQIMASQGMFKTHERGKGDFNDHYNASYSPLSLFLLSHYYRLDWPVFKRETMSPRDSCSVFPKPTEALSPAMSVFTFNKTWKERRKKKTQLVFLLVFPSTKERERRVFEQTETEREDEIAKKSCRESECEGEVERIEEKIHRHHVERQTWRS